MRKKTLYLMSRLIVCLCVVLTSTTAFAKPATWIGNSYIHINDVWYNGSGTDNWATGGSFNGKNLGAISSLYIGGEVQVSAQDSEDWGSGTVIMYYKFDDGEWQEHNLIYMQYGLGQYNNNMKFQSNGSSFADETIDISSLTVGSHNLSIKFGPIDDQTDDNNGSYYVASFTKVIDISSATVTGVDASYDWTGDVIHPVPVVTVSGTTLTSSDYDVTYSEGCANVGDYTITITGKGNYTGTKEAVFSILVPVGYYLVGTMNSWELNTNYKLTQNSENPSEYYINNVALSATDEIKVARTDDGKTKNAHYPGGSDPNYVPGATMGAGTFFIYCNPDGQGGAGWHYGTIYATKNATVKVALAPAGYGTYYNSTCEVTLPSGVVAYVINNATPTYEKIADGNEETNKTVPAGTAVMLYGATSPITLSLSTTTTDTRTFTNLLHGSDVETTTNGGGTYYKLTYDNTNTTFGWYWGAENGTAFTSPAHKAWLVLPAVGGARPFLGLPGDDFTGITTIENMQQNADNVWYDLNGRRINTPMTKGIYINDGRKIVIK